MFRFVLRRIGMVIPTFIGITVLAFALIHLIPGDPIEVMMGERGVDPAAHAEAMKRLGLDQPLPLQYLHYVGHALKGDLGMSIITNTSVFSRNTIMFSMARPTSRISPDEMTGECRPRSSPAATTARTPEQ